MIHNRFVQFMIAMLVLLIVSFSAQAQDNDAYQIALERIEEAASTNATSLDLSNLYMSVLPPEIGQLGNLQELDLTWNGLISLPPEIGQLTNLQELDLSGNRLTSLPPEIGQLTNLQELDLSGNRLTNLPPDIGQLSNLRSLSLSGNNLTSLPPEIGQLTHLQRISLLDMPSDVRSSDIHAQIDYLINPTLYRAKQALIVLAVALVLGALWYKFERIRPYFIFILSSGLSCLYIFSTGLVGGIAYFTGLPLPVGITIVISIIIGLICTGIYTVIANSYQTLNRNF